MVIRAQVADLTTGDRIQTLPSSHVRWEQRILSPETISVDVTLKPRAHQRLDLRNSTVEGKTALIVSDDDHVLGAGPIWERTYDDASMKWSAAAEGVWAMLDHRHILPPHVTAQNLVLQSGDDEGEPNPAVATRFTARTWPQIVRGLIEQSMSRPGGQLPFRFGPDGTGAHDKGYDAASFKTVGEALDDLTKLVNGPEIVFTPRLIDNRLEWLVQVGDDAKLEISSPTVHTFDFTAPLPSVRGLKVKSSGKQMASETWGTGGRSAAVGLFSRAESDRLHLAGFPRMELVSSAHSTVTEQATLDRYTEQDLVNASSPVEWWEWQTHADRHPRLADLRVGDYCVVKLQDNAYLPDGEYDRRIVALSGDSKTRWVTVVTDEVVTW